MNVPTTNDLLSLVARASDLMGSTLEPDEVTWSLARLLVPTLADWSIISLVGGDGRPSDVQCWHREESKRAAVRHFAEHRFGGRTEARGSLSALASGEPFVLDSGAADYARRTVRSPEALAALEDLELESAVVAPMLAGGEVIGLITLVRAGDRSAFTPAEVEVAVDLARRAANTLGNARSYARERSASERLQLSLLTEPVAPAHLDVVTRYIPAAEEAQIGGDWYDVFTQPGGATVLVVGDVAGHDIAAAAMMGQLRSMLRGIAVTTRSGPARLLTELDLAIEALDLEASATAAVARLDVDGAGAHRLTLSNAGHPLPLLVGGDGSVRALGDHDTLLGVWPEQPRQEWTCELHAGDTLLLFSDGLVERRDRDTDIGDAQLQDVLAGARVLPLGGLVDRVLAELVPAQHDDDVAVLAVRLRS